MIPIPYFRDRISKTQSYTTTIYNKLPKGSFKELTVCVEPTDSIPRGIVSVYLEQINVSEPKNYQSESQNMIYGDGWTKHVFRNVELFGDYVVNVKCVDAALSTAKLRSTAYGFYFEGVKQDA